MEIIYQHCDSYEIFYLLRIDIGQCGVPGEPDRTRVLAMKKIKGFVLLGLLRIMRFGGPLILGLFLAACASSSVQRIGTVSYLPRSPTAEVFVFTDANQVQEPYEVVGIISYTNPGKYQVLSLGDAIDPLKMKAREIGANAIIIDKSQPIKSGFISTGIYAEARAILLQSL